MRERIRTTFFEYGWLLPLLTPAAQVGGRALINILLLIYLLWALLAVPGSRVRVPRPALLLWLALLLAYLASVPGAIAAGEAAHEWGKFMLHSLVFYFTLVVLQRNHPAVERLIGAFGTAGLLLLVLLLAVLPWQMTRPDFAPTADMLEDNLPFLMPFVLYWVWRVTHSQWRLPAAGSLVVAIAGYIVFSQGRAALAGLLAALFLYALLVMRLRTVYALLVSGLVLIVAVTVSSASFFRMPDRVDTASSGELAQAIPQHQDDSEAWVRGLDRFTSFRTQLWRQALSNPPPNMLTGIGMGNVSLYGETTTLKEGVHLGHLHNFLLDCWYETGFLGLTALLAFVGYPLWRGWRVARAGGDQGIQAGLFLVSASALLVAGLLSFSYGSRQFALYLPMLLAALWHLFSPARNQQPDS